MQMMLVSQPPWLLLLTTIILKSLASSVSLGSGFRGGLFFASLLLGLVGVLAGLWSEKFDHLAAVQNFIVMPMTFLSGTFYAVEALPEPFETLSHFNPFFYLIDGFRYGFIGSADGSLVAGMLTTVALTLVVGWVAYEAFRRGWRLKS